ncbi:hypothetical protein EJB05_38206, partial [Eragrostis curvula]
LQLPSSPRPRRLRLAAAPPHGRAASARPRLLPTAAPPPLGRGSSPRPCRLCSAAAPPHGRAACARPRLLPTAAPPPPGAQQTHEPARQATVATPATPSTAPATPPSTVQARQADHAHDPACPPVKLLLINWGLRRTLEVWEAEAFFNLYSRSLIARDSRHKRNTVELHLCKHGFREGYEKWTEHGEMPVRNEECDNTMYGEGFDDTDQMEQMLVDLAGGIPPAIDDEPAAYAKAFYRMVASADERVHDKTTHSSLSAIACLLAIKSRYNMSIAEYDDMLGKWPHVTGSSHIGLESTNDDIINSPSGHGSENLGTENNNSPSGHGSENLGVKNNNIPSGNHASL